MFRSGPDMPAPNPKVQGKEDANTSLSFDLQRWGLPRLAKVQWLAVHLNNPTDPTFTGNMVMAGWMGSPAPGARGARGGRVPRNGAGEVARGGAAAAVHAGAGVFHGGLMGFLWSLMEWDLIYLMGFTLW